MRRFHILLWIGATMLLLALPLSLASAQKQPVPTPSYPVATEDQHWLAELQNLPYSKTPYEGAPVLHPALVTPAPEELKQFATQVSSGPLIHADGPETAGTKVWLGLIDKEFQLPSDVYIVAAVATVTCLSIKNADGTFSSPPCPKTPYWVLGKFGSDAQVRLESDGQVYIWERIPEKIQVAQEVFSPVLKALGTNLKVDPPFESSVKPQTTATQ